MATIVEVSQCWMKGNEVSFTKSKTEPEESTLGRAYAVLFTMALVLSACGTGSGAELAADSSPETSDTASAEVRLWVHCGARFLEFEGSLWEANVPEAATTIDWLPESWDPFVDNSENLLLSVARTDDILNVSPVAGGAEIEFGLSSAQNPGCD